MPEIKIREMRIDDFEDAVFLIKRVLLISNSKDYSEDIINNLIKHYSLSNFRNMYFKRKSYVALLENKIVGTVACEGNKVYTLFVDPDYQNKGIGKSLLREIEEHINNLGFDRVELSASITAVFFYRSVGYIELKRIENHELGEVILMEKIV